MRTLPRSSLLLAYLATVATLATAARPAAAQAAAAQAAPDTIKADDLVRVRSPRLSGKFRVLAIDPEKLILASRADTIITLPTAALTSLAVSRGARSSGDGAMRGFSKGLGIGIVTGLVIGFFSANESGPGLTSTPGESAAFTAMVFGTLGAGVGLLYGAASPGQIWAEVPVSSLRATLAPAGGLNLTLSLRFQ